MLYKAQVYPHVKLCFNLWNCTKIPAALFWLPAEKNHKNHWLSQTQRYSRITTSIAKHRVSMRILPSLQRGMLRRAFRPRSGEFTIALQGTVTKLIHVEPWVRSNESFLEIFSFPHKEVLYQVKKKTTFNKDFI